MAVERQRIYHKRDRLRQLRAFCRVAQMGSITRAAESLDLTQPAVSLHVRQLEYELDAVLFDRSGRGVSLSPAGERLYKLAEPLVLGMDRLSAAFVDQLGDIISRRIYFGASEAIAAFVLPRYLKRFQELYPEMRLRVRTCRLSEGVEHLLDDELEFVVGANEPSLQKQKDILYHHIAYYDLVLITASDHPLAGRETVSPKELAAHPAVAPTPSTYSRQLQDTAAQRFGVDARVAIEVGRWGVIKRYVETGLGIAIVPSLCLSENDALSTIPIEDYLPPQSYGVVTRRGKFLTRATKRLVQLMVPDYPA